MRLPALILAAGLALGGLGMPPDAVAKPLRWSSQGDFLTADPHAMNEGINNTILSHVYERLTTLSLIHI